MHSITALIVIGSALLGQPGGVTESDLPPPGSSRVIEQPAREIVPLQPAAPQQAPQAQAPQAQAAPRLEERGNPGNRPVAAFWFVLQGS